MPIVRFALLCALMLMIVACGRPALAPTVSVGGREHIVVSPHIVFALARGTDRQTLKIENDDRRRQISLQETLPSGTHATVRIELVRLEPNERDMLTRHPNRVLLSDLPLMKPTPSTIAPSWAKHAWESEAGWGSILVHQDMPGGGHSSTFSTPAYEWRYAIATERELVGLTVRLACPAEGLPSELLAQEKAIVRWASPYKTEVRELARRFMLLPPPGARS